MGAVAVLRGVVRVSLRGEVMFEQRPEGGEEMNHVATWDRCSRQRGQRGVFLGHQRGQCGRRGGGGELGVCVGSKVEQDFQAVCGRECGFIRRVVAFVKGF